MLFDREEARDRTGFSRRALLVGAGQCALLGVLGARLYKLQVTDSAAYSLLADENRINVRLLAPERGEVRDRFGRVVATNEPILRALAIPEQTGDLEVTVERVGRLVGLTADERRDVMERARKQVAFLPLTIADNLTWEDFARLNVHSLHLPGVFTEVALRRRYPMGPLFAHVAGHVGAVERGDLDGGEGVLRLPGFAVGRTGIERLADATLRGRAGQVTVEIEASGRVVRELERTAPVTGSELILTVDQDVQALAMEQLEGQVGAVVVMDVENGEVLALASSPSFDPRQFEDGMSQAAWQALANKRDGPMTNRAVAGLYPPGSTFKIATALAALGVPYSDPEETINCLGAVSLGSSRFRCWKRGGHGEMNLHDALTQSCDVYFYKTAQWIGIEAIAEMARRLGIGEEADFAGAKSGVAPDDAWKRRTLGERWYTGETLIAGIGQGYVLATPLELAVMTARVANGRFKVRPRFIRYPSNSESEPEPLGIPQEHIGRVRAGMWGVVNGARGTARASRLDVSGVQMAGKTGTSQVVSAGYSGPEVSRVADHALFVAFAPASAPAYAVSVIVEHGGSGSRAAAPIARDVLTYLVERRPLERTPYVGNGVSVPSDAAPEPTVARG